MWRDPLDELVDDLERLAPSQRPSSGYDVQLLRLQRLTDAILYGSADQVAALMADPAYQQWVSQSPAASTRSE
jgi:hypothetical protein